MSYINKDGKTSAWRQMVIRQQVSDVIAYGQIETSLTKAKETRRHVERIITLAKKQTLASRRQAMAILLDTKNASRDELGQRLFDKIAKTYKDRPGGYTRILKMGPRGSDATELAVLQLV